MLIHIRIFHIARMQQTDWDHVKRDDLFNGLVSENCNRFGASLTPVCSLCIGGRFWCSVNKNAAVKTQVG